MEVLKQQFHCSVPVHSVISRQRHLEKKIENSELIVNVPLANTGTVDPFNVIIFYRLFAKARPFFISNFVETFTLLFTDHTALS
jgi:hypothetical protein